LTDALKETLQEQYPDGIDTTHIKTIPTAKGEVLRVIELLTADALYLIKINPGESGRDRTVPGSG
jgi:hypothetical protein